MERFNGTENPFEYTHSLQVSSLAENLPFKQQISELAGKEIFIDGAENPFAGVYTIPKPEGYLD